MRTLLDERFAPITSSIGFIEKPVVDVVGALEAWRRSLYGDVRVEWPAEPFPAVLHRLEPLVGGARPRELVVEMDREWTAYFDCSLRGTDAVSTIGHLSTLLGCSGVAVRCVPHTIGLPRIEKGRAGAVQFELFGPLRTDFANYVRTVSSSFDGHKWVFSATGTIQAFEQVERYSARRLRDRFTSEMLEQYCRSLGIDVFSAAAYGPRSSLITSAVKVPEGAAQLSLAEAQRVFEVDPDLVSRLPG